MNVSGLPLMNFRFWPLPPDDLKMVRQPISLDSCGASQWSTSAIFRSQAKFIASRGEANKNRQDQLVADRVGWPAAYTDKHLPENTSRLIEQALPALAKRFFPVLAGFWDTRQVLRFVYI